MAKGNNRRGDGAPGSFSEDVERQLQAYLKDGECPARGALDLNHTDVDDATLARVLADPRIAPADLRWLNLTGCKQVSDTGLKHLTDAEAPLHTLDLSGCNQVSDTGLKHLADAKTPLHTLNLWGCERVSDAGLKHLADAKTPLQSLNLSDCKVSDTGLKHLADAKTPLQSLNLSYCERVSDTGLKHLTDAKTPLHTLNLQGCKQVSDTGLKHLADAKTPLHTLDLWGCDQVSDTGLKHLADAKTPLQSLDLSGCERVSDTGLKHLTDAKTPLHTLDLWGCDQVSDTGLKHLADAKTPLQSLDLSVCERVSDTGLKHLADAKTPLHTLNLWGCKRVKSLEPLLAFLPKNGGQLRRLSIGSCDGLRQAYRWDEAVLNLSDPEAIFAEVDKALAGCRVRLPMLKVMVLGEGAIGKTRLRHRLNDEPPPEVDLKTDSFEIVPLKRTFESEHVKDVELRLFDVAGQRATHGASRLFLASDRNLFVIVCRGDLTPEEARLPYWLRMTYRFAGEDARVLVVVSWGDSPQKPAWTNWAPKDPLVRSRAEKAEWVFGYVDRPYKSGQPAMFDSEKLDEVNRKLDEMVRGCDTLLDTGYAPGFRKLFDFLTGKGVDDALKELPAFEHYWPKDRFYEACRKVGGTDRAEEDLWLDILGNLGVVCWLGGMVDARESANAEMKNWIFHPDWIKKPIYGLTESRSSRNNLPHFISGADEVQALLSHEYGMNDREITAVLAVMRTGRLMFDVNDDLGLPEAYLFVDRLNENMKFKPGNGWTQLKTMPSQSCTFIGETYLPRLIGTLKEYVDDLQTQAFRNVAIFTFREPSEVEVMVGVELNDAKVIYNVRGGTEEQQARWVGFVSAEIEKLIRRDGDRAKAGELRGDALEGEKTSSTPHGETCHWCKVILAALRADEKPLTVTDIAKRTDEDRDRLSECMKGMETLGLVRLAAEDKPRSGWVIVPTNERDA